MKTPYIAAYKNMLYGRTGEHQDWYWALDLQDGRQVCSFRPLR